MAERVGLTCAFGAAWSTCRYAAALVEQGSHPQPHSAKMQKAPEGAFDILAERVGFEPTKGYKPLLVFKTSAFDHSATSPVFRFAPRIVLAIERKHNISV